MNPILAVAEWTTWSPAVLAVAALIAFWNLHTARAQNRRVNESAAADRALVRFNRINEVLLREKDFNRVLRGSWHEFVQQKDDQAKTFIWYIFNQFEGIWLDYDLGILKPEYFTSYESWLRDQLRRRHALFEFLGVSSFSLYFSAPFWSYLQAMLAESLRTTEGTAGS